MKLVILGNGFDLGGGLPTSYKNYFEDYKLRNKEKLENITKFLEMKIKSDIKFNSRTLSMSEEYDSRELEISREISERSKFLSSLASDIEFSIWNLFFWHSDMMTKKGNEDFKWSDVETQISKLIKDFSEITFIRRHQKIKDIEIELISFLKTINIDSRNSRSQHSQTEYSKNIFFNFRKEDRFRFICDSLIFKRYETSADLDYLCILKKELILFENNFKTYIANISENLINKNRGNISKYRNNFFKVTNDKINNYFLINFNYTDFSSKMQKESVLITRDKNKIEVNQVNVHGVYYTKIIFGIDQTEQNKEEFFQFTKTYRKMELQNEIPGTELPAPQSIDEIIIYGHSLSMADYSYFHSIFDYYDLHGSNIKVKFAYSVFGKESNYNSLKNLHIQNVMRVLKFYGEKMFDTERSKNLVHKMLLENRLMIKEVKLEKLQTQ